MSGTDAILEASSALARLIATGDPSGAALPAGVVLGRPEAEDNGDSRFSLWLYRVIENEFQKNVPTIRNTDQADLTLRRAPLVLALYYLLTPFGATEDRRQERLGEAMQRVYTRPLAHIAPGPVRHTAHREQLHLQLFPKAQIGRTL